MTQVLEWGNSRQQAPMADKFVNFKSDEPAAFRIFSPVVRFGTHWVVDPQDPEGRKKKKFICPEVNCPLCRAGERPRKSYASIVLWDPEGTGKTKLEDRLVRILEFPHTVYQIIEKHALDEDYGYPDQYDVKVTKTGKEMMTRYETTIRPVDKCEKLTQKMREQIQLQIDDWSQTLEEVYRPADPQKIKEFLSVSNVPEEPQSVGFVKSLVEDAPVVVPVVVPKKKTIVPVADVSDDDDTPPFDMSSDDEDLDNLFN